MRRVVKRVSMMLVLVLSSSVPVGAQNADGLLFGPLRVRDLMPLTLPFLDFVPAHGVPDSVGVLALEVHLSHANTFIQSGNIKEYLEGRDRRAPLSRADFETILGFEEDAFYFDGAAGYLNLTLHYVASERWQVYVHLPFIYYEGGFLDRSVEGFHDSFGFSQAGRDLVARDQVQFLLKLGDDTLALIDSGGERGLADPVIGARYALERGRGWNLVFEAAIKLPLGDEEKFLSSGTTDIGLQISAQKQWNRAGLYLSGSYIRFGDADLLPTFRLENVFTVAGSLEWAFRRRWSLITQLSVGQSPFDATDSELSDLKMQGSIGIRRLFRAGRAIEFALTENIQNFNNTPDIGFHLGFAFPLAKIGGS